MGPRITLDEQLMTEELASAPMKDSTNPAWWRGRKPNGVLPPWELEAMANADCRFLDPETRLLMEEPA